MLGTGPGRRGRSGTASHRSQLLPGRAGPWRALYCSKFRRAHDGQSSCPEDVPEAMLDFKFSNESTLGWVTVYY